MGKRDPIEEQEGKDTVKVTDRRHFTSDGERRVDFEDEADERSEPRGPDPEPPARTESEAGAKKETGFRHRPLDEPDSVDFTMLVNAMAQPALLFLGEIPHPSTGMTTLDLEQARLQIDMLDLLRVKCRGNLSPQEESLLEQVLYQLRMVYVSRSSGTASG